MTIPVDGDPVVALRGVTDRDRLLALVEAVLAIGADLSLPDVLRRIVKCALEVVGARYGALGVLDEQGHGLSEFVHVGFDDETVAAIGHLPEGRGILGLLIVEPHVIRIDDLTTHQEATGFPPGHPPMRSLLGIPIEIRGQVYGNLYLTEKQGAGGFSADDEALVAVLARAAAVAIENARLLAHTRELTLLQERERIAADLHDRVIQRLFATGLGLESLVRAAGDQTGEAIQAAVESLDSTIREIRSTIFSLQARRAGEPSLRAGLLQLAAEASGALGFEPAVRFEGPVDSVVTDDLADDLLATAREALINVARHAKASRAELELRVAASLVEMTVTDDGVGPGEGRRVAGKGVGNLTNRAEARGGGFELTTAPAGQGCRARWWAPLQRF